MFSYNVIFAVEILVRHTNAYGEVTPKSQIVYTETSASITCSSFTQPMWSKDGVVLKTSVLLEIKDSQLIIARTQQIHNGNYTCKGTHEDGQPFTEESELLVGVKDNTKITSSFNRRLDIGDHVAINCMSSYPVRWYFNRKHLPFDKSPISWSNYLVINSINKEQEGLYFCFGRYPLKSRYFIAFTTLQIYDPDIVYPYEQIVKVNKEATFVCKSEGSVIWYFNDNSLPMNVEKITMHKIVIRKVNKANQGYYSCEGNTGEEQFVARGILYVRVNLNDKVSPRIQKGEIGGSVIFTCSSKGPIDWYFKGASLPINAKAVSKKLEISEINYENEGIYTCHGYDILPKNEIVLRLYFEDKGKLVIKKGKKSCPSLDIKNGVVKHTGTEAGDMALYQCKLNHNLQGNSMRMCEQDGSWTGVQPKCHHQESKGISSKKSLHIFMDIWVLVFLPFIREH